MASKEVITSKEALKELKKVLAPFQWIDFKTQKETGCCIYQKHLDIIEKDLKALVVLKDLFDFDFALRFPSNQPMLKITNKRTNEYWEISITQEEFDLLKEVFE